MGRRLGQHFLFQKSFLDRIAAAACPERQPLVIEIGPGRGPLTACLLERAERVVAIELDNVLVHYLRQKFRPEIGSGRLELVASDVLKADLSAWGPAVVAGNIPYYITSPILERVFRSRSWVRAVFLVQKEVAARLTEPPGSREYGYLSVMAQTYARPELLFAVPAGAFRPPPKVDSAVVRFTPVERAVEDSDGFLAFAGLCFSQKRKKLRNNLLPHYDRERVDALPEANVRAETLSVGELASVYRRLTNPEAG
ncbi:MAG: 16S rRNA (adenine(1518)-N(6)/adenine(1519)-N(6))-dimethyltransferase RsmA [Bryobacteraceae bacterium]|nr:16S rRNA (adenine(1518)-N(6)/adenine(1519)-N(6))-dimethyltransferase RsmA [Bryobacteraceae bacterium]